MASSLCREPLAVPISSSRIILLVLVFGVVFAGTPPVDAGLVGHRSSGTSGCDSTSGFPSEPRPISDGDLYQPEDLGLTDDSSEFLFVSTEAEVSGIHAIRFGPGGTAGPTGIGAWFGRGTLGNSNSLQFPKRSGSGSGGSGSGGSGGGSSGSGSSGVGDSGESGLGSVGFGGDGEAGSLFSSFGGQETAGGGSSFGSEFGSGSGDFPGDIDWGGGGGGGTGDHFGTGGWGAEGGGGTGTLGSGGPFGAGDGDGFFDAENELQGFGGPGALATPEPSSLVIWGLFGCGSLYLRRRRR